MFCPNCGAEIEQDSVFCGNCGNKIQVQQVTQFKKNQMSQKMIVQQPKKIAEEPQKSKKRLPIIPIVVGLLAVVVLVAGALFFTLNNKGDSTIAQNNDETGIEDFGNGNIGLKSVTCHFESGDIDGLPYEDDPLFEEYELDYEYDENGKVESVIYQANGYDQKWVYAEDGSCSTSWNNDYDGDEHIGHTAEYDSLGNIKFRELVGTKNDEITWGSRHEYIYENEALKRVDIYSYEDGGFQKSSYWDIEAREGKLISAKLYSPSGEAWKKITCQYNSMRELSLITCYDSAEDLLGKTIISYEHDEDGRIIEKTIIKNDDSGSLEYNTIVYPVFRDVVTNSLRYSEDDTIARFRYEYDEQGNIRACIYDEVSIPYGYSHNTDQFSDKPEIVTFKYTYNNEYAPIGGEIEEVSDIPTAFDLMLDSERKSRNGFMKSILELMDSQSYEELSGIYKENYTTTLYYQNGEIVDHLEDGTALIYSSIYGIYYGEVKNGKKNGHGVLWSKDWGLDQKRGKQYYYIDGNWTDDSPDGVCEVYTSDAFPTKSMRVSSKIRGTYNHGYEDGNMEIWLTGDETDAYLQYTSNDGKREIIAEDDGDYIYADNGYNYLTITKKDKLFGTPLRLYRTD